MPYITSNTLHENKRHYNKESVAMRMTQICHQPTIIILTKTITGMHLCMH